MNKEIISDAITLFGNVIVREVLDLIRISNVEVMYNTFKSMNMKRHADCIEFLFL